MIAIMSPPAPKPLPLTPEQLYTQCDPLSLPYATTEEAEVFAGVLGQARALEATQFGIGIRRPGYNLFVHGPEGSGRPTTLREILDRRAADEPIPSDWCLVNNFADAHRPIAIELPAGKGGRLREAAATLVEELKSAIPSVFEAEDYRNRREAIDEAFKERQEAAFAELQKRAQQHNISMLRTSVGLTLAPVKDGDVIPTEVFEELPEAEREQFEEDLERLQSEMQETVRHLPEWDKERREQIRDLNRKVTRHAVGHLMDALRAEFEEYPAVTNFLDALQADVIENADAFMVQEGPKDAQQAVLAAMAGEGRKSAPTRRYEVNLLIDNAQVTGAPVIYEDMPTYANLIGRIEHIADMGALITDFTMIKGGALHRANGGYLLIDAYKLFV